MVVGWWDALPPKSASNESFRHVVLKSGRSEASFFVPVAPDLGQSDSRTTNPNPVDWVFKDPGEHFVLSVFRRVLHNGDACSADAAGQRPVVLDIGANEGFFGLLATAWGCRAVFFEPQPGCQKMIRAAFARNSFSPSTARLVPHPVAEPPAVINVSADVQLCLGGWPFHSSVKRTSSSLERPPRELARFFESDRTFNVTSVDLSDRVLFDPDAIETAGREIMLAKVDVEGGELSVLRAMLPLLRRRRVRHLVVELTPGWWSCRHAREPTECRRQRSANGHEESNELWAAIEALGYVASSQDDEFGRTRPLRSLVQQILDRGGTRGRKQANVWIRRATR